MSFPLSIITITYNAEKYFEPTIKSILSQTRQDFQYIVIDGLSTDRTLDLVNKYKKRVDFLLSEPDSGLYDAMNKGLDAAEGKYVWFMNAGDEIAEASTVERLLACMEYEPDVIYSDTYLINEKRENLGLRSKLTPHRLPKTLRWEDFKLGMVVGHQSFIVKKKIAPKFILNNLSADIDWEIRCLKNAKSALNFPRVLSKYLLGGISTQKHWKSLKDRYAVLQIHFGVLPNIINHIKIIWRHLKAKL